MAKLRLSQCMIVKNEEKNIRRALSWGRDIMWEQIVVDTGSTDRTAQIAQEMGAKLFRFDWIDDFAAAKNHAIRQAGGDWIVFLDADEYLSPEDTEKLLPLLEGLSGERENAVTAAWVQTDGREAFLAEAAGSGLENRVTVRADGSRGSALAGTVVRIFRNQPGLLYRGRIHEQLSMEGGEVSCYDASASLSVLHTGYTPEEMEEKKKTERNIRLLQKEVEQDPSNYKMLAHLGGSYFQQRQYEEAARWYEEAVRHMPKRPEEESIQDAAVFKNLLFLYSGSDQEELLQRAYAGGTGRFPKEADYDYMAGQYYFGKRRFQEGAFYLSRAVGLLDQYGSDRRSTLLASGLSEAWEMLAECLYETGDRKTCVNCAVTLLKADPHRRVTLEILLKAFRDDEKTNGEKAASAPQVLAFLGNLYDLECPEQRQFVRQTAESAEYGGLVRELEKRDPPDGEEGLGRDGLPDIYFFPAYPLTNMQLLKDRVLIPYVYYRHFGRSLTLVTKAAGDYPYLDRLEGARMEILSYPEDEPDCYDHYIRAYSKYIREHYRTMDLLFLFQPMPHYVPLVQLYRKLRPDGKIYLKLDVNSGWMDRFPLPSKELGPLLDACNVISAEGRRMQRLLSKKRPWIIDYIPNGYYTFGEEMPRTSFEEKEDIILTVGRIGNREKNNEMLLEGFALAASELPSWSLRLVGPVEEGFRQFCGQFFERHPDLKDRVILTGPIMDKQRLNEEYRKAKIFALTSNKEGFPNVFSEAALLGCNMVVTDIDAAGDMTGDGAFGITVPIGDADGLARAFLELCRDEARMRKSCLEIQAYVRRFFDYDRIVRRLHILLGNQKPMGEEGRL